MRERFRQLGGIEIPEFAPILPIETGAESAVFVILMVIVMLSRMSSRVAFDSAPNKDT